MTLACYNTRLPADRFYEENRHILRYVRWNGWFALDVLTMTWEPIDPNIPLAKMSLVCQEVVEEVRQGGDPLHLKAVSHLLSYGSVEEALRLARSREPILTEKAEMQEIMGKRNLRW